MAWPAKVWRFENSAQDVATSAIRKGASASKVWLACWSASERRRPLGSSSNKGPLNETSANASCNPFKLGAESSKTPPSTALMASCVIVAGSVPSKMEGADEDAWPL